MRKAAFFYLGGVIISLHCSNAPPVCAFCSNDAFCSLSGCHRSFLIGLLSIAHLWKLQLLNCPSANGLKRLQAH